MRRWPLVVLSLFFVVGCGQGMDGAKEGADTAKSMVDAGAPAAPVPGMQLAAKETPIVPRLIVRNGDITLRVKDLKAAEGDVNKLATTVRGSVEASEGSDLAGPTPSLSITLRVPEPRFIETMDRLEGLGVRLGKTISSEDVTSQAVDLDARLTSLRTEENAYRAILANARKVSDVLQVQEKLTGVRTTIEQLVAQRRGLGDQAARSTIVVHLTQTGRPESSSGEPDWANENWAAAVSALKGFGRGLASVGIWGAAMTPVWLPAAAFLTFVVRRSAKTKRISTSS